MDTVFWIGLVLGGLLSIPLSITANLWTDRVRDYLDTRRTIRLSRRKSKEAEKYLFVRALMEGDPSAKVYFDIDVSAAIRNEIIAAIGLGFSALWLLAYQTEPKLLAYVHSVKIAVLFTVSFGTFCHLLSMIEFRELRQIRRKLRRFADYEKDIREKWGDNAIEEFLATKNTHLHAADSGPRYDRRHPLRG